MTPKRKPTQAKRPKKAPAPDPRRLLQELKIHQVELETQNEELRLARLEIEAGLARYTELFDFAPIGYALVGSDEQIREINHVGARLLKGNRARLVGTSLEDHIVLSDRPKVRTLLGRTLESQTQESGEVETTPKSGSRQRLALTATVLPSAQKMVLLAFEDVTGRRANEERLARTEAALREADRRKDEFMATLSHELRNPLAAIQSSLFVLQRGAADRDKTEKASAIIGRQVTQLARLIDDLLDVTRINRGKIQLRRQRLELGALVCRTLDDHDPSFEASGLILRRVIDAGPLWVNGDPARLVQSLANLLINARKFTSPDGIVTVTLERQGGRAVLRIRDTGAGIEPQLLPHLFEPFAQGPQTMDRSRGGLGLGLAVVKGLIELHGGTIGVASEGPGRGTEVTIALPLEVEAPAEAAAVGDRGLSARRRTILVIEDNADAAESMKDALTLSGHAVEVAHDGSAGVKLSRALQPEIVICDIGLPEMDGYAVARALRSDERSKGSYLVALSGYGREDDVRRAYAAGFNRHLTKPVMLAQLAELISEVPTPQQRAPGQPGSDLLR